MTNNARECIHHFWVIDDNGVLQVSRLKRVGPHCPDVQFKCVGLGTDVSWADVEVPVVGEGDPLHVTGAVLVFHLVDSLGQRRCLHLQHNNLWTHQVLGAPERLRPSRR